MTLSETCSPRNTQTGAKEEKKKCGNRLTLISYHPLPVYCQRLDEPVCAIVLARESHRTLLDDCFDMEGKELLLPDHGDKFRTSTFQDYVLPGGAGR